MVYMHMYISQVDCSQPVSTFIRQTGLPVRRFPRCTGKVHDQHRPEVGYDVTFQHQKELHHGGCIVSNVFKIENVK